MLFLGGGMGYPWNINYESRALSKERVLRLDRGRLAFDHDATLPFSLLQDGAVLVEPLRPDVRV